MGHGIWEIRGLAFPAATDAQHRPGFQSCLLPPPSGFFPQGTLDVGNVFGNGLPNHPKIHSKIGVNELISHASDVSPWDGRKAALIGAGKVLCGLSNDFQLADDRILQHGSRKEIRLI
jgi:hypothetical protein